MHQKVENLAFVVNGPPEPELPPRDRYGHLVEMPARRWPRTPTAKFSREQRPELQDPASHRFAFLRGYRDLPLVAGLRLTIVPIALGIVAPFAGAVSDRYSKLILVSGPVICGLSALGLIPALSGAADSLPMIMAGLGVYGIGLGVYIASNNNETMAAAPVEKSATAGGLLNLLRIFGGAVGVAASATLLAWASERCGRNASPHKRSAAGRATRGGRRGVRATRYFRGHRRGNGASPGQTTGRSSSKLMLAGRQSWTRGTDRSNGLRQGHEVAD